MVRILGILVGIGFVIAAGWSLTKGFILYVSDKPQPTVEHRFHEEPRAIAYSFDGPFGRFDRRQLQRGFQVFSEVCSNCHSLEHVAFRDLRGLGYTEAEVRAIAERWPHKVATIKPTDGMPTERNAIPADHFPPRFPNETAARAANGNALPPDLSLMAKAREGGPAYIESLITGYRNPPADLPAENRPPATLYYNPYFANLNIAMPPPLADGQVRFADGSPNDRAHMAHDVAAFLAWAAEPAQDQRKNMGIVVLIFLLCASALSYMAYQNVWAGKKH